MSFDPKPTKYPFPKDTGAHYLKVKRDNGLVFDKDYPYVDRSLRMRFGQLSVRALLYLFVFAVARVRLGLRVEGRNNLKKHRETLKNGFVSCCNHVHLWDFICVLYALRPRKPYLLAWAKNIRGENSALIRLVRGIPIPENDPHALAAMNRALAGIFAEGQSLHVYAEGSMWEFYRPVRPFKTGAAYIACRYGKPVLPLAFSYREPGFIRRKIFRQQGLFTLRIGEPLFADPALGREEQRVELTRRMHGAVCALAGIDPKENVYPPVYENSERVDYYGTYENWEQ